MLIPLEVLVRRVLLEVASHPGPCTGGSLALCGRASAALAALDAPEPGAAGWVDVHAAVWEAGFGALLSFVYREGSARVPRGHVEGPGGLGVALWEWVDGQRAERRVMPGERRARLEAVPGWSWGAWEDVFDAGVGALRAFGAREGHLRVPEGHVEAGVRLDLFVGDYVRAEGLVGGERRRELESVPGWRWDRSRRRS